MYKVVDTSKNKPEILKEGNDLVEKINKQYSRGLITNEERFNKVIETWNNAKNEVQKEHKAARALKNEEIRVLLALEGCDDYHKSHNAERLRYDLNGRRRGDGIDNCFYDAHKIKLRPSGA